MKTSLTFAGCLLMALSLLAWQPLAIRRNQVGCYPWQEKVIVVEGINPTGKVRVTTPTGKTMKPKAKVREVLSPWSDK